MPEGSVDGGERLLTGYSGRLSATLALGWLSILLGRQALPPLLPTVIDELAISPSRAGFALTLMMGLYALSQYPGGRLSDDLSRVTVLVASLVVTIAGFLALSVTPSYAGLLAAVALVGLGAGFYFSPARALVSDLFTERRGQAMGMQTAAGLAGSTMAAGVAAVAVTFGSWRPAFLPAAVLLVVVLVLLHGWSREPYVVAPVSLDLRGTAGRLVGLPGMRRMVIAYALFAFALQGLVGFLPVFLQAEKGFSPALASAGFGLLYVVGMAAGPAAGRLSDRHPRALVTAGALGLGMAGLLVALLAPTVPLVLVGVVVTAAGLWSYTPVMQAFLMDRFPDDSAGADFGALKTLYTGVGSLGPTYVGLVAERASYTLAFSGLAACLLVGALVMLRTRSARGGS